MSNYSSCDDIPAGSHPAAKIKEVSVSTNPSADVFAVLSRAVDFAVDGSAQLGDIIGNTTVLEIRDEAGRLQGAFALQLYAGGRALRCTAAGSVGPGVDVLPAMIDYGTKLGEQLGVDVLTITTKRRGLVRKMQQAGFEVGGYVMKKRLKK